MIIVSNNLSFSQANSAGSVFDLQFLCPFSTAYITCVCVLQEASRYYNQTNMQLQMLEFSRQHLVNDDEVSTADQSVTLCI